MIALALPAGPAQAQDTFTVNGPTFVTNGGPLAIVDGDDTLIVTAPAGSITVGGVGQSAILATGDNNTVIIESGTPSPALNVNGAGGNGISMFGDNSQAILDGRIEISGGPDGIDRGFGIVIEGNNGSIQALDTIIAAGDEAVGIAVFGDDGRVIFDGSIDVFSDGNIGIWGSGDRVTLTNTGSIGISGVFGNGTGILLTSEDGLVVNAGSINNAGPGGPDNVIAIDASGDRVRVINLGTIVQSGDDSIGVQMFSDGGSVLNEGSIELSGAGVSRGIFVSGSGNTIDHTGTIAMTDPTGTNSLGILVIGGDNIVSVTGNGEIWTAGANGRGISVSGIGNRVFFDGLVIQTTGDDASGIVGGGGSGIVIETGSTNGAEIVTQGTSAYGISIQFNADDATVLNGASIVTNGLGAHGIFVEAGSDNPVITNSGEITTNGNAAGIRNDGQNAVILNSGEITTNGLGAHGIWNEVADGSRVENSGVIELSGQTSNGLYSFNSNNVVLLNSGEILVTGATSSGMQTFLGSDATLINTGLIRAEGAADEAILASTVGASVLNSGEIRTAPGINGIDVRTDDVFVRNTGRIFSGLGGGEFSFTSNGSDTHLRLDPGSIIVGELQFLANGATLDVGLPNAALTWNLAPPDNILSDGSPQLVVGTTLYVFDPDHFAAMDQAALSALNQVGFALDQRQATGSAEGRSVWATGTIASADDTDTLSGMLGGTFALSADRRIGGFVGTQDTEYETPFSSSQIDSRATFGGLTWGGTTDYGFFETALSFGTVSSTSTRRVANNTVPTGIENAVSSPDSRFFSLSATFGTETRFNEIDLRPSLRLRYSWVQSDAFAETGSQADLTVEERSAQRLDLRAKVETDLAPRRTALGPMAVTLYGGLDLAYTDADDVRAVAAGQPVVFGTGQSGTSLQGFIGGHATIATRNGASLSLSGELAAGGTSPELRLGMMYSMRF
ncbi:MAG: autotransporter domain-containing protein [Roseicyclus sp.]|nr:autotransporter domain-containing protein [Roseicyclus sp.]MBO6923303.1 autotransporter domain-containing protein [Roseicyclus sp.]